MWPSDGRAELSMRSYRRAHRCFRRTLRLGRSSGRALPLPGRRRDRRVLVRRVSSAWFESQMSAGKLTVLSADCDGSGAVVGSSAMVADSSGAEGAGWDGGGGVGFAKAGEGAARAVACSAARSVTNAAPKKTSAAKGMSQSDRDGFFIEFSSDLHATFILRSEQRETRWWYHQLPRRHARPAGVPLPLRISNWLPV
jgi:hypothetical protein